MSSVIRYAADVVRTFRDALREAVPDHDLDTRDMRPEQLDALSAAFGKVSEMCGCLKMDIETMAHIARMEQEVRLAE